MAFHPKPERTTSSLWRLWRPPDQRQRSPSQKPASPRARHPLHHAVPRGQRPLRLSHERRPKATAGRARQQALYRKTQYVLQRAATARYASAVESWLSLKYRQQRTGETSLTLSAWLRRVCGEPRIGLVNDRLVSLSPLDEIEMRSPRHTGMPATAACYILAPGGTPL